MFKVLNGQNPYSAIGKYIRDNTTTIEDMIAIIEIDGITMNELFLVDMHEDGYFVWKSDWWNGEKDIALIDFFPVSDVQKPSAHPEPFGTINHAGLEHPLSDEEIIPRLRQIQEQVGGSYAIDRAIELLTAQPQPCEDAVSRETLVNFIKNASVWVTYKKGDSENEVEFAENIIKQTKQAIISMIELDLPSALPKQRTGYWYPVGMAEVVGGESAMWGSAVAYHKCSECDEQALLDDFEQEVLSKWCPHCGAKMEGASE